MAKLGLALKRRFPQYASYYRAKSFTYDGRTFKATNNLLGKVSGVDGLKTGLHPHVRLQSRGNGAAWRQAADCRGDGVGKAKAPETKRLPGLIEAYS